jgi:hypothetical protein
VIRQREDQRVPSEGHGDGRKMNNRRIGAVASFIYVIACHSPAAPGSQIQSTFKFADGQQGLTAGVSDYSTLTADGIHFISDYRQLLPPLDSLFMSSRNSTDDVFMLFKCAGARKITDVQVARGPSYL